MRTKYIISLMAAALVLGCAAPSAADITDISNFRSYSDEFASSGQPTKEQLSTVADAGFERVIYLAFTTSGTAIDDEDEIVKELGMDYVHIPVDWEKPTSGDFYNFAAVMRSAQEQKTLLHCQVNFRASTFSFLYRVIYEGIEVADAKEDMNSVWQPNQNWVNLVFEVLNDNDISPECEVCDWTAVDH